ncbi:MAG: hypothetical protein CME60_07865 [Halobacteriovoraceae bacterium]|nr:hypothetical protein [Halobacteriovoraceae bacterium]
MSIDEEIGMNIYKCTILALSLCSVSTMASLSAVQPANKEIVESGVPATETEKNCEELVESEAEQTEEIIGDESEQVKKACKKGPKEDKEEFNPDYNSDDANPIGGVTGGTKIGVTNLITAIFKGDDTSSSRKILAEYNIDNIHQGSKEIVITIDDGPTPGVTDKILDSLAKYNAQAVFFVIGEKAQRYPSLMRRIQREGHIVANHSMTHANLGNLSFWKRRKVVKEEFLGGHEVTKNYATNSPYFYFRAPYGSWEDKVAKILNRTEVGQKYIGPLLWDIGGTMDTQSYTKAADWACWSKGVSVSNCLQGYTNETLRKKGGVVLFHDLKKNSAQLIDGYLKEFSNRSDYRFISIDELDLQ